MAGFSSTIGRTAVIAAGCLLLGSPSAPLGAGTVATATFRYNGTDGTDGTAQTWVVPAGVTRVTVIAEGAAGGRNGYESAGGLRARVTGRIDVTPGEVLRIRVGGKPAFNNPAGLGGYNGGGAPGVQGLPETIIPAGGGGGAGAPASQDAQSEVLPGSGGVGGDSGQVGGTGGLIGPLFDASRGGEPGLADSGGLGGQPGFSEGMCGFEGLPGVRVHGGPSIGGINYSGGGGGSNLVPPGGTLIDGYKPGHGRVIIRYQVP